MDFDLGVLLEWFCGGRRAVKAGEKGVDFLCLAPPMSRPGSGVTRQAAPGSHQPGGERREVYLGGEVSVRASLERTTARP